MSRKPALKRPFAGSFTGKKTEVPAVDDISFSMAPGEIVGFLGPNGAGKTTTLKMLSGLLYPTREMPSCWGTFPGNGRNHFYGKSHWSWAAQPVGLGYRPYSFV